MEPTPDADPDRGAWIETYSGSRFYILDPTPEEVSFYDIAHALSLINRYTGHTKLPVSVGQHVLFVADMARKYAPTDKANRFETLGLLHDFEEAYIGDLHTPLKRSLWMVPGVKVWWDSMLHRLNEAIYQAAGVVHPNAYEDTIIKFFDLKAFMIESFFALPGGGHTHDKTIPLRLKEMAATHDRLPDPKPIRSDSDIHFYLKRQDYTPLVIETEILSRLARLTPEGE